nr:putative uncharacterized protein DDB_G0282133 [Dermatophagoides farinae]
MHQHGKDVTATATANNLAGLNIGDVFHGGAGGGDVGVIGWRGQNNSPSSSSSSTTIRSNIIGDDDDDDDDDVTMMNEMSTTNMAQLSSPATSSTSSVTSKINEDSTSIRNQSMIIGHQATVTTMTTSSSNNDNNNNRYNSNTFPLISRSSIKRPLSLTQDIRSCQHQQQQQQFYHSCNHNTRTDKYRCGCNQSSNGAGGGSHSGFRSRSKTIHSCNSYYSTYQNQHHHHNNNPYNNIHYHHQNNLLRYQDLYHQQINNSCTSGDGFNPRGTMRNLIVEYRTKTRKVDPLSSSTTISSSSMTPSSSINDDNGTSTMDGSSSSCNGNGDPNTEVKNTTVSSTASISASKVEKIFEDDEEMETIIEQQRDSGKNLDDDGFKYWTTSSSSMYRRIYHYNHHHHDHSQHYHHHHHNRYPYDDHRWLKRGVGSTISDYSVKKWSTTTTTSTSPLTSITSSLSLTNIEPVLTTSSSSSMTSAIATTSTINGKSETRTSNGSSPIINDDDDDDLKNNNAKQNTESILSSNDIAITAAAAAAGPSIHTHTIPTVAEKEQFQRSLDSATTLVFHRRSGLPLNSSPAPIRKSGTCFDFDSSLTSVNAIKKALFHKDPDGKDDYHHPNLRSKLSLSAPTTTSGLLGNFEESVLNGRLDPASIVHGFTAEIGASGGFCPSHKTFPVTVFFYTLQDTDKGEKMSSPYLGHINLGEKGYHIPRQGTVQVTLFNPNRTVVKMFVVRYDLSDMPPNCRTFLRQRTLFMPSDANEHHPDSRKWLRYLIHLRFQSSKSGRIRLHTDIRILVFRKHDLDVATMNGGAPYELRSFVQMPSNPKYSKNIKT